MFARRGIGTVMALAGLVALFTIGWKVAVGVFLVVWGNDLWRGPDLSRPMADR